MTSETLLQAGRSPLRMRLFGILILAALYYLTGSSGLRLHSVNGFATVLWAPTGISIAALLLFGTALWPGIALGSLLVNLDAGATVLQAIGIGTGNCLESTAAVVLIHWTRDFDPSLSRVKDISRLLAVAPFAAAISATIGSWITTFEGPVGTGFPDTWLTWWVGDIAGATAVAPLILSWATRRRNSRRDLLKSFYGPEVWIFLFTFGFACWLIFLGGLQPGQPFTQRAFLCFPFVIWAALRFPLPYLTAVTAGLVMVSATGALTGLGPFGTGELHQQLINLELFILIVCSSGLLISSSVSERLMTLERQKEAEAIQKYYKEQQKIQKQLDEAQRLAHLGSFEWDVVGDRVTFSRELVRIFDFNESERHGYESILSRVHPEDKEWVAQKLRQAQETGSPFHFEERILRSDGTVRNLEVRGVPIMEGGRCVAVMGSCQDITERKRIEFERDQLLIKEKLARAEAENANRAKDYFLATLSHELRTPLTTIQTWSQLLRSKKVDPSRVERGLEMIEQSAQIQGRMIHDLLDISRIIMGKLKLDIQVLDPCTAIEAALDSIRPDAEAKKVRLEADLSRCEGRIRADPLRLRQIVWNLLNNAISFTSLAGTESTVGILAESNPETRQVRIRVEDRGSGIPPELLPKIFEPFVQADPSSTRRHGGLGIGLTISKRLSELQGGGIRAIRPEDGVGAIFEVTFPTVDEGRIETDAKLGSAGLDELYEKGEEAIYVAEGGHRQKIRSSESIHSLEGICVLLIDDDDAGREALAEALRLAQAKVVPVMSAQEGLNVLRDSSPDIVISDIAMPGEDGYSLIRRIRKTSDTKLSSLPALALTAYAGSENASLAIQAGFNGHISKPVEIGTLTHLIRLLLNRSVATA